MRAVGFVFLLAASVGAQTIDRVLAVVSGHAILLSDAMAAIRFGLVQPTSGQGDPVIAVLPPLIERHLQLAEVNRYGPPEPTADAIEERMASIRRSFADPAAFDAALAETGLTLEQLRERVRDNLRIISYRQQRFGAALLPSDDDVARYYRAHATEFYTGGTLPSFEQVREEARRRLILERSESLIRDWLDGLRRRAEITVLYREVDSR